VSDQICVYNSQFDHGVTINGDYLFYLTAVHYDGFRKTTGDLVYIRYMDDTWKIGYDNDLSEVVYAECQAALTPQQVNPFDITSCNGYWALVHMNGTSSSCCDALIVSNTLCADKPTLTPTALPTTASPSLSPTEVPTNVPTYAPTTTTTMEPSLLPTVAPTTVLPTTSPSENPTHIPTHIPTQVQIQTTESTTWKIGDSNDTSAVMTTMTTTLVSRSMNDVSRPFWHLFEPSDDVFWFAIMIVCVCVACVCCLCLVYIKYRLRQTRKASRDAYAQRKEEKDRHAFREQLTMDVTQRIGDMVATHITNAVTQSVARTTKEVLMESIHSGGAGGGSNFTSSLQHSTYSMQSTPHQRAPPMPPFAMSTNVCTLPALDYHMHATGTLPPPPPKTKSYHKQSPTKDSDSEIYEEGNL